MNFIHLFIIFAVLKIVVRAAATSPTWQQNLFTQAGTFRIIDDSMCACVSGNTTQTAYYLTYNQVSFFIPEVAFGIINYQGNDGLSNQKFQITPVTLSFSSAEVKVKILGITNIWVLQISYLAVNIIYPNHLNILNDVPIQYNNGPLSFFNIPSPNMQTYQNTIDYHQQTQFTGAENTYFNTPLSNNKFVLFITSLHITGSNDISGPSFYPIKLSATGTATTTSTYQLSVEFGINASLNKLHFDIIVFDISDRTLTGTYTLVSDEICYSASGGSYLIQYQFGENFMVGLVGFQSLRTQSVIYFQSSISKTIPPYGHSMINSTPRISTMPSLSKYCFSYFYIKSWSCPPSTFLDSSDMCGCPLTGCLTCLTISQCADCDQSANYFITSSQTCQYSQCDRSLNLVLDTLNNNCVLCTLVGCLTCFTQDTCQTCDNAGSYYLLTNLTCQYCAFNYNFFYNSTSMRCELCTIPNCTYCSSLQSCVYCTLPYVLNPSTTSCQLCSLVGCITCISTITCGLCDANANYIILTDNTCQACSLGLFVNTLSGNCQSCNIANCLLCASLSTCATCDTTNSYYLDTNPTACKYCNASNNQFINNMILSCQTCSLAHCLQCSSLSSCSICDTANNYFLASGGCQLCTLPNCVLCSSLTACQRCDNISHFINTTSHQCQLCTLSNCLQCQTLTTCAICDNANNYFLAFGVCQLCSLPSCIICSSLSTCQQCDNISRFINTTSHQCQLCTLPNCLQCHSLSTCLICDTTNNYFLELGICQGCTLTGCIRCSSLTICQQCDNITHFINTTSYQCQICSIPYCLQCHTLSTCSICDISNNHFPVMGRCVGCTLTGCIQCSSLTTCQHCDNISRFINTISNQCEVCTIPNCIQCQTLSTCNICDTSNNYFLAFGFCQPCTITGCLQCLSLISCQLCDTLAGYGFDNTNPNLCGPCFVSCTCDGYGLPWRPIEGKCTAHCGDGLVRLEEQCDDNNLNAGDGCSPTCRIDRYYTCVGQPSNCSSTFYISAQFVEITKANCNQFKITAISTKFTFNQISDNIFILNNGVSITKIIENGSYIQIYAEYHRDISNQTILLKFSPGQQLNITYTPDIPALYYSQQECKATSQVKSMIQISQYFSYGILAVSLFSQCSIIGLQLFGALQLSYTSLSSQNSLNIYLQPLSHFKTFNGYNIELFHQETKLPDNLANLGIYSSFINNCNVMVFGMFGLFVFSSLLYGIATKCKLFCVKKISIRLLKQGSITLILFNISNICFSAGIHWRYASPQDQGYVLSSFVMYATLISVAVAMVAMEVTQKKDYGQFKSKYKNVWICQIYVNLTICLKMAVGFYSSLGHGKDESELVVMTFPLAFTLYFLVNLPFNNVFQNYRCAMIQLSSNYSMLLSNYYGNILRGTALQEKGRMYGPAIMQLVLLTGSIVSSSLVLVYQIVKLIKRVRDLKLVSDIKQSKPKGQQSFQNLPNNVMSSSVKINFPT